MASRYEKRLILGKLLGLNPDGHAKHELEQQLSDHNDTDALTKAYMGISRKVNGFKGKPKTRVTKATASYVEAVEKAAKS